MSTITCFCKNTIEIDFPTEIDLTTAPDTVRTILDGTFMSVVCDECGRLLKPELPVRLLDRERSMDVFMVPEMERASFMLGKFEVPLTSTVVVGYLELVEWLRLTEAMVDRRANEMAKHYLARRAETDAEVSLYFQRIEGDMAIYHVHGLREGEIGVARVPTSSLRQMEEDIPVAGEREPFKTVFEEPYISMNKVSIEEED